MYINYEKLSSLMDGISSTSFDELEHQFIEKSSSMEQMLFHTEKFDELGNVSIEDTLDILDNFDMLFYQENKQCIEKRFDRFLKCSSMNMASNRII